MPVEVKVRCMNKLHKIVLGDNGQLCLCNHDGAKGVEEIQALMALGLGEPRCLQVFNWWRQKKLTDVEMSEMPDRLLKVWKIIRMHPRAYRLMRTAVRKRRRKETLFDDLTVAQYPGDIDRTVPEGVTLDNTTSGGYYSVWKRKRHIFALVQIVEELKRRGFKGIEFDADYKRTPGWNGQMGGWTNFCRLWEVDGVATHCDSGRGQGTAGAFTFGTYDVNLITTRDVPYKIAADMVELQRHTKRWSSWREKHQAIVNAEHQKGMKKLKQMFLADVRATLETYASDDKLHVKMHMKCADRMSAAILLHWIRKMTDHLVEQDRMSWGKPPQ